jgi:hypothetical protein
VEVIPELEFEHFFHFKPCIPVESSDAEEYGEEEEAEHECGSRTELRIEPSAEEQEEEGADDEGEAPYTDLEYLGEAIHVIVFLARDQHGFVSFRSSG